MLKNVRAELGPSFASHCLTAVSDKGYGTRRFIDQRLNLLSFQETSLRSLISSTHTALSFRGPTLSSHYITSSMLSLREGHALPALRTIGFTIRATPSTRLCCSHFKTGACPQR